MPFPRFILLVSLCATFAAGCERTLTLSGQVVDTTGGTLPGVAVIAVGTGREALTNARGEYVLMCPPNTLRVDYTKTGYTIGHVPLAAGESKEQTLDPVVLYPLPEARGVYQTLNHRYHELTRTEARQYAGREISKLYGTKKVPELVITDFMPTMIVFRLPSYDIQCSRLDWLDAAQPGLEPGVFPEKVLAPVESLQVFASPLDEPERQLIELQFAQPLQPGTYALHWGALNGYFSTEKYAYLFRIRDPDAPDEPLAPEPAPTEDAAATEAAPAAEDAPIVTDEDEITY